MLIITKCYFFQLLCTNRYPLGGFFLSNRPYLLPHNESQVMVSLYKVNSLINREEFLNVNIEYLADCAATQFNGFDTKTRLNKTRRSGNS